MNDKLCLILALGNLMQTSSIFSLLLPNSLGGSEQNNHVLTAWRQTVFPWLVSALESWALDNFPAVESTLIFSKLLGDNKPRDKNHCFHMGWQSWKEGRMQTHIRSYQTALIRVQHSDNLGRRWCVCVCVCVCSFRDTNGRQQHWQRKKFVGVCFVAYINTDMMQSSPCKNIIFIKKIL